MTRKVLDIDNMIDRWLMYGIDLSNRQIHICEEIDEDSAGWVIRAIDLMEKMTTEEPIHIRIDSYGGGMYESLALYDRLRECGAEIITRASGKVMSAGVTIFLAGDIRTCSEHTTFMLHSLSSFMEGKAFEMNIDNAECQRLNNILMSIIADRSGKSIKFWTKELKYKDLYFDSVTALDLGIVNELTV